MPCILHHATAGAGRGAAHADRRLRPRQPPCPSLRWLLGPFLGLTVVVAKWWEQQPRSAATVVSYVAPEATREPTGPSGTTACMKFTARRAVCGIKRAEGSENRSRAERKWRLPRMGRTTAAKSILLQAADMLLQAGERSSKRRC